MDSVPVCPRRGPWLPTRGATGNDWSNGGRDSQPVRARRGTGLLDETARLHLSDGGAGKSRANAVVAVWHVPPPKPGKPLDGFVPRQRAGLALAGVRVHAD